MQISMSWIEFMYWASTIVGGTLFILRTLLLLVGGMGDVHLDGDIHAEFDGDFDADMDAHPDAHHDTDASFKLLSLQGLTAFFMMFGLVGLATYNANMHPLLTILAGALAGLFTMWVIALIFQWVRGLQSEGTINIHNAVGSTGEVYLTIPPKGTGQVRVAVQGALKIFDAVSADNKKIATGEKVRVTDVVSGNILKVETL